MVQSTSLGYPRIGPKRELKKALEAYWKGTAPLAELEEKAKELRLANWILQHEKGIDHIPSNDFSYYDLVLDTSVLFGAIPERYNAFWDGENANPDLYFAMARGAQIDVKKGCGEGCGCHGPVSDEEESKDQIDVTAAEMTKWFDTNYHYIVPEFEANQQFKLCGHKPVDEYLEAKAAGIETRPALIGPITYLLLGKCKDDSDTLDLIENLLPVYEELISTLSKAGAKWIQLDEPFLALDISNKARDLYKSAYERLKKAAGDTQLFVTTYFESLRDNLNTACALPVDALHVDLVRGADQLDDVLAALPSSKILSVGVVNGRNIWRADLSSCLQIVEKAVAKRGADKVWIAPSCSLLFSPYDLDFETALDDELKTWLAFAKQKLEEVTAITNAVNGKKDEAVFAASDAAQESRKTSKRIHNDKVKQRVSSITPADSRRKSPYAERRKAQIEAFNLPFYPTTTIGSFPQTTDVRQKRAAFKRGDINEAEYNSFLKDKTKECVKWQEDIGIDVLVHGEFERNDMVEYFGEKLDGFTFTKFGWVQSYGSRCVKPPVLYGDVSRPNPMTVEWSKYANELTDRHMKGMLTGPITILQWSFVRDDQPRSTTTQQIAFALRDEVCDLENAGIKIIQIDEPALREGLPLRRADWDDYLKWAVEAFRISASGVEDSSQIHTHMCYCEFNDIIQSIADLDADVISIETSRSQMELLDAFTDFKYPNEIGPGVYDIHSPRVPSRDEMVDLLKKARQSLKDEQIWVNPDCGLKTRGWEETKSSLKALVDAAKELRAFVKEREKAA